MFTLSNAPKFVIGFSFAALVTGCGNTATISRINAPEIEAEIQSSDGQTVYVKNAAGTTPIARETITDIDHPGNVLAVVGGVFTAYGIANIAVGASNCDQGAAYCTGVFLPATSGLAMLATGLYRWSASKRAAEGGSSNNTSVAIVPTISTDKKNEYVGVSAAMRF